MYSEILQNAEEEKKNEREIVRLNASKNLHIPWLEKYLPYEYRGIRMPDYISVNRDRAIVACFFHIASSIAGFSFYFLNRNRLYLIINSFSFVIALIGTFGVINLSKWFVTGHAMITLAIFGSVCVYSVLESIFNESLNSRNERGGDDKNYTETHILLLLAIPYLIDFLTGLMTFYLATLVIRLEDERKPKKNQEILAEFELPSSANFSDRNCLICSSKEKNAVFYNCGHKMACMDCAKNLKSKYQPKCPLCRAKILDIIQEYE